MGRVFGVPSLLYLGYGLMSSWVVCTFFLSSRECLYAIAADTYVTIPWIISSGTVAVALALNALLHAQIGLPGKRTAIGMAAAALIAIGTVGIFQSNTLLNLLGALATGVGTAWLWIMWGEFFAHLGTEEAEHVIVVSSVAGTIVVFIFSLLPSLTQVIYLAVMPLICYVCCALSLRSVKDQLPDMASRPQPVASQPVESGLRKKTFYGRVIFHIGIPCLLIFILNTLYSFLNRNTVEPLSGSLIANIAGFLLYLAVLILFFRFTPAVNEHFILKWSVPFIVFAAILLPLGINAFIGLGFLTAGMMIIDQFRWIYTAKVYRVSRNSVVEIFGLMCALYQAFVFLGSLTGLGLLALYNAGYLDLTTCSICILGGLCLLLIAVFDRNESLISPTTTHQRESAELKLAETLAERYALSARECEILSYLLKGRNAQFIRDELTISQNTVNTHIKHIYSKMGVHNRQELIDLSERMG